MFFAFSRTILVHGDIKHPIRAVLHGPDDFADGLDVSGNGKKEGNNENDPFPSFQLFKLADPLIEQGAFLADCVQTDIFGNQRTVKSFAISGEDAMQAF